MTTKNKVDHGLLLIVVGLAAWAVPGGGHFIIKERKRAIIIFVTVTLTFLAGLYVGSIAVIDRVGAKPWYAAQIMASPAVGLIGNIVEVSVDEAGNRKYVSYGRGHDVGQIYTSIAGMLNLLCIISAVYMTWCGRGEMIGAEEDDT
ncbi:MAG: hypothetical protein DRP66_05120 [Planctomycetota bacterium]|nr:MAG: hypothetical protein DRP66_05120 [Planctomycetota bacterium]